MLMAQAAEILEIGEQRGQLISREVNNAVHAAFNALQQTVLVNNSRTLEDLLREMLQPVLKAWLDDNLPGMVECLCASRLNRYRRRAVHDEARARQAILRGLADAVEFEVALFRLEIE